MFSSVGTDFGPSTIFNTHVFRRHKVSANVSYHGFSYDNPFIEYSGNLTLYDNLVYRAITPPNYRLLALIEAVLCFN